MPTGSSTRSTDVLVVGAGPAGSSTAVAIGGRLNVLMIDAKKEPGKPIHCAGGIARYWLSRLGLEPPRSCFAAELHAVRLKGGPPCTLSEVYLRSNEPLGYVLYRDRFDSWLVEQAEKFNALTLWNTTFRGLGQGDALRTRRYALTTRGNVSAKIVVGADGPLSMVGHAAGLPVGVSDDEMCAAVQYLMELPDYPPEEISLFFGERIAPGGYAWVFPYGDGLAEVGLGVVKSRGSPKPWLHRFLVDHKEYVGKVVRVNGGVIPLTLPARRVWKDNVVLVGEAARLTVSSHGGGIATAVKSGQLLGRVLAAGKPLSVYERALKHQLHPFLTVNYLVKLLLYGLTDWQLREVVEALSSYRLGGSEPNPVREIPKALLKVLVMRPFLLKRALSGLVDAASKALLT